MKGLSAFGKNVAPPAGKQLNRYEEGEYIDTAEKKRIVIFVAGTGNPYFTTDTAASLRAVEIEADIIMKGTRVAGIYTSDPEKDATAQKYETISFSEVLKNDLSVMDMTAFTMCKENKLPIIVFNINKKGNLLKIIQGEKIGTLVS